MRNLRREYCLACAAALLLVTAHFAAAQDKGKRSMTFMDVMELRSVGGAQVSPDGRLVIYTVSIPQWKAGKNFTDIFVAPADGSWPARQLTFTREKNETSPRWARDSKTIGFLSDREGSSSQLYLLRTDGGEARKVSDAKDGVNTFDFSRDGKWLAFSAGKAEERQLWLVDLSKEDAAPVQLTKHSTPLRSWSWTADSARIFFTSPDTVDKDDTKRKEKKFDVRIVDQQQPYAHLWSVAVADKSEKRWTSGEAYGVANFDISDDSKWVVFRSDSNNRHRDLSDPDSEIYVLDLSLGRARRVTENKVGEGAVSISPDSKWILFSADEDFTDGRNSKLYVTPIEGGPSRKLLAGWDYNSGAANWSADSRTLYMNAGVGVDDHWFSIDVTSGKPAQLTRERGAFGGGTRFDTDTGYFVIHFSDPASPGDIFVARPETIGQRARWVRASNANPQVKDFLLGEFETVRWKSSDGLMVEGILIKPANFEAGKKYPLIVQVHGGPAAADQNGFNGGYGSYVHVFAGNGYVILKPNYRGSDQYGEKFRTQIAGDYFRQAFDDIMLGVDSLIARGVADPDKMGMMGWSAGGHWSNWTLTHTDRFKAISSGAGAMNWISMYAQTDIQATREFYFKGKPWENWDHYLAESPLKYIKNAKTPTLIHVCQGDPRVPKPQSDELHMALKKLGVPTEYIVYPQNTHGIGDPRYQMVKMVSEFNWFEKWIKGKEGWFDWKQLLATLEEPKEEKTKD